MTRYAQITIPGVTVEGSQDGGRRVQAQVLHCSYPGCTEYIRVTVKGSPKPAEAIYGIARKRSWSIHSGRNEFLCPVHALTKGGKSSDVLEDLKTEEPMTTTSENKPRTMTREDRRAIFREIDDCYDKGRYVDGVTDKTIGEKLKMPWAWVKAVRDENFGPAGPSPEIAELRKQIANLETRVEQVEAAGLAALEHAEGKAKEFRRDIASLLDKINKIEGGQ